MVLIMAALAASPFSFNRAVKINLDAPKWAYLVVAWKPRPELAPVTRTVFPLNGRCVGSAGGFLASQTYVITKGIVDEVFSMRIKQALRSEQEWDDL